MNEKLMKIINREEILDKKFLFIGLDGGSKKIVDELLRQKKLPVIEKLINNGSYFTSHSDGLGASPVLWTSISTGKKQEKHGINSFYGTSENVTAKRIWEIFDELGFPVGVFGHFISWPPKKLNGFLIPDLLALDNRCYPEKYGFMWDITNNEKNKKSASPGKLLGYFVNSYKNGVKLSTLIKAAAEYIKRKIVVSDKLDSYYSLRIIKTLFHKDLFVKLYRQYIPKYSFLHIHLVDGCSHRFWKHMQPEHYKNVSPNKIAQHGSKIYDAYCCADRTIGEIVNCADSDTVIILASDHGFKAPEKDMHWANNVTLNVNKFEEIFDEHIRKDLNFSLILPFIHLSIRNVTPEKNEYCKKIIKSAIVVEDGKHLFNIHEVDHGNLVLSFNNKDIREISGKRIDINGRVLSAIDIFVLDHDFSSGVHDIEDGMLVLCGPDIKRNYHQKESVQVTDIMPTILALCNMPVGNDMDGNVIEGVFDEQFMKKYPVRFVDSYESNSSEDAGVKSLKKELSDEETESLKDQLKNLGYL
ncbi:type I phosphodiesterase / nucleotide pyrophosphatase [bacterium BMS3Abin15]|nr:type I phosphodiesterase / nucleotide pyrophosphatase [bacterium BMS3Abin15]